MKANTETAVVLATTETATEKTNQVELFGGLFKADGELSKSLKIKETDNGTSISLIPRTGNKIVSGKKVSGLEGDALKAWYRKQQDALKMRISAVMNWRFLPTNTPAGLSALPRTVGCPARCQKSRRWCPRTSPRNRSSRHSPKMN